MVEKIEAVLTFLVDNWKWLATTITTIIGFASALIKTFKYRDLNILKDKIFTFVQSAEELDANGKTKLEIVLSKSRLLCIELGIKYDEERIKNIIETSIEFSKYVNKRDKDELFLVDKE